MRDPHVERLHYNFHGEAGISYGDPPPLSFSNYIGKFSLQNQKLVVEPTDHYSSQDMARAAVDPFLRCWEIKTWLNTLEPLDLSSYQRMLLIAILRR